jgi:hypothetical protein
MPMTTGRGPSMIVGVTAVWIAHLQLDVDLDADPIAGSLKDGAQAETPFSGWMELARTIELSLDHVRARRLLSHDPSPSRSQP